MRKILDQKFWSHGTPLGYLGAHLATYSGVRKFLFGDFKHLWDGLHYHASHSGVIRTTLTFLILWKTDILAFSDRFAIEISFVFWVYGLKQPLKASKWPLNFSLKP